MLQGGDAAVVDVFVVFGPGVVGCEGSAGNDQWFVLGVFAPRLAPFGVCVPVSVDVGVGRVFEDVALGDVGGIVVDAAEPPVDAWVVGADGFEVAHEDGVVCGVEAGDGGV